MRKLNTLTQVEIRQLYTVAVLAFRAVESMGTGELPGRMPELDRYLANEVGDELWDMLNESADKQTATQPA